MRRNGPYMAQQAEVWMKSLASTEQPADYFKHPLAFPMLLLPWWMEQTLHREPDLRFQADLIYSSVNGYFFIRMIDNVMDGHSTIEQKLLPMLSFFHVQFHSVYRSYFTSPHAFWTVFKAIVAQSAESALRDAALTEINLAEFTAIAGKKVSGAKIPLAAIAYRYDRPELFQPWELFYDKLGRWHQLYNDLFGWAKDLRNQTPSYFLAEGRRRKQPEQSITAWVVQEGFAWGSVVLETWLGELQELAESLQSPGLIAYLYDRQELMQSQFTTVAGTFKNLAPLLELETEIREVNPL